MIKFNVDDNYGIPLAEAFYDEMEKLVISYLNRRGNLIPVWFIVTDIAAQIGVIKINQRHTRNIASILRNYGVKKRRYGGNLQFLV